MTTVQLIVGAAWIAYFVASATDKVTGIEMKRTKYAAYVFSIAAVIGEFYGFV